MDSNSCFSKTISIVFPLWHYVNTRLYAEEQQDDKTPTSTDDHQFISASDKCLLADTEPLNPLEAKKDFNRAAVFHSERE
ncbi:hypothetical protein CHARACLAT_009698 [Characodon lateralis]|uniref:Uncharacterized protein n=1 Tax=Characodon lateralis TaxID=208331 RepID=A0ABU7F217_9TELE|nr:hypothetical protein [Characodon lateralis]